MNDIDDGDVFYDIGSNIGLYACFVALAADDIFVYAFEPHPNNAERLRENFERNNITGEIIEAALADSEGEMNLILDDEIAGSGQSHISNRNNGDGMTVVKSISGDHFVSEHPSPDMIKIDVEGAEMLVLDGFSQTLRTGLCRSVYCELHPNQSNLFNADLERVYTYFQNRNYKITELEDRGYEKFVIAELQSPN